MSPLKSPAKMLCEWSNKKETLFFIKQQRESILKSGLEFVKILATFVLQLT